ncbi:MAG: C-GCAxxG-C-C family protein [Clostridiaceae bacterium]|nr:C-GCAxxG-C-C family protein [Clostridiaceae bacterium]
MLKEKAIKYYDKKYDLNCAEAIVYAANEVYELNLSRDALKAMAGFGGGMAVEDTCGAVTGAVAVLGIIFVEEKAHESDKIKELVKKLFNRFEEKMGTCNCKLLKEKYREEEPIKCKNVVAMAAEVLEGIIEELK